MKPLRNSLTLATIICLLFCMASCGEKGPIKVLEEWPLMAINYRFVNETEHDVEYFGELFDIPAGQERIHREEQYVEPGTLAVEIEIEDVGEGCFRGIYNAHYFYHAFPEDSVALIRFDDDLCLFYKSDQDRRAQDFQNFEKDPPPNDAWVQLLIG